MAIFNRTTTCPVHLNHAAVDRARKRIERMSFPDLYDWSGNVAVDLAALVDKHRQGEEVTDDLVMADAMMHACVVEILVRVVRAM
jgi:hypothetical protein